MSKFVVYRVVEDRINEGNAEKHTFTSQELEIFDTLDEAAFFANKQLVAITTECHTYLFRANAVTRVGCGTVIVRAQDVRDGGGDVPIREIHCENLAHYGIKEIGDLMYPIASPDCYPAKGVRWTPRR